MDILKDYEDLFIFVYCLVDNKLKRIRNLPSTRSKWTSAEILTVQIVGELMRRKTETSIHELTHEYFYLFKKRRFTLPGYRYSGK